MDFREKLTDNLKKATELANQVTVEHGAVYVGSEHLIYGFLCIPDCEAYKLLSSEGVTKSDYERVFIRSINPEYQHTGMTPRTTEMFRGAQKLALDTNSSLAGTAHFLYAVLGYTSCEAVKLLRSLGVEVSELKRKTQALLRAKATRSSMPKGIDAPSGYSYQSRQNTGISEHAKKQAEEIKKKQTSVQSVSVFADEEKKKKTDGLPEYGLDLTERAKQGKLDPVIGRQKEIEKLVQVLSRRSKNNPVLIGEPGVGKSAIIEGLAQLIVAGEVPDQLLNKTVFSVDITGMLAGARYRGDFEERLKELVDQVIKNGDIVLFIDEIHTIVGAGSSSDNSMDAANILKPMLARGDLQVIGATTIEEYRKYIEKDAALERRFTPVQVDEPNEADAITILKGLKSKYEQHHGIAILDEAIETAVKLSIRYVNDRFLPDKAIDLIDEAAARARITSSDSMEMSNLRKEFFALGEKIRMHEARGEYMQATELFRQKHAISERLEALEKAQNLERLPDGRLALGKEQVAAIVSARMNIPLLQVTQEEGEKLMRLEEDLHKRIIGQNEGVNAVAKAIRRARAGLKDPSRPIGSFIFVGPTGVGKTDLCKALSEALFGSEEQMIRLDMSEFMEKQSVSKLIGAPPGYVGHEDTSGQLTEKVRTKPYCVILFDEIEKAHPDVFNLLLQILDDGRLTDSKGRTVSFKNAVIILTSNVGAAMQNQVGELLGNETSETQYERMKENITTALKAHFRPELLNRLDDIIVFHPLSIQDAARIAEKMVDGLAKRLMEQRGISLVVTDTALEQLVLEGYDSQYGARPLKRIIQRRIEDKLSEEILVGKIRGGERVTVDFVGGEIVFTRL